MTTNTCGACTQWRLSGPLGKLGYGTCDRQTNPMLAASLRTASYCVCRIAGFTAKPVTREPIDPERLAKLSYGGSD